MRRTLYLLARFLGDVSAVRRGSVGRRVLSRIVGRGAGQVLRWIVGS